MLFPEEILHWYHQHKRNLPWRETSDPYAIWLSEVILQQTRVEQGLPYFNRFIERYPTVQALATADEGEVLRLWEGLGYYSRARNMHKAAQQVLARFQGIFPHQYKDLISLPGIGAYTAAAISSFSANEAQAVLDGNVFRLLSRYFGIETPIDSNKGKKIFQTIAQEQLYHPNPGLYNQAIMEFGALQCKPQRPDCAQCPLQIGCFALKENKIDVLPVKGSKKAVKNRYFYYFIIRNQGRIAMQKRGPKDIWENLYEFPLIELPAPVDLPQLKASEAFKRLFSTEVELEVLSIPKKHILSHQHIYATFIEVKKINHNENKKMTWNYVFLKDLDTLAKPKLIFGFLRDQRICNI